MVSEVTRRGVHESKDIDYAKQHHTPHCWLPAQVMYPANSAKRFSWLTRLNYNLFDAKRSDICAPIKPAVMCSDVQLFVIEMCKMHVFQSFFTHNIIFTNVEMLFIDFLCLLCDMLQYT